MVVGYAPSNVLPKSVGALIVGSSGRVWLLADDFRLGRAFGATRRQLLFKVELPHALPTIMEGITQCIMLSLSMVVIAALVGADGLGKPVVRALNSVNIAMGFEAGLAIVILAIVLDRIFKRSHRSQGDRPS